MTNIIVAIVILLFFGYVIWSIFSKAGKLPEEGFLADKNKNDVPDGVDELVEKVKDKVKKKK